MPPFFLRKRITGNSKWQFLHVIELEKTKRVCPIFIFYKKGITMRKKLKKATVLFCTVCMLNALLAGCGSQTASAPEAAPKPVEETPLGDANAVPSADNAENEEKQQETATEKRQVLDAETAAAFDADFLGEVWKISEDSFYIAETKAEILEDGSLSSTPPSSDADIPDSQLIQVMFDDATYFYMRGICDDGENFEDVEAGFQDLKEKMSVDLKGSFKDGVFYATEIRMPKIS